MRISLCAAFVAALIACGLMSPRGYSEETASPSNSEARTSADSDFSNDLTAIRAGSQAFVDAFNAGDAKAVAECWTEDGDYVDETGRRLAGREAIAQEYAALFAAYPETKIRLVINSLKMLGDGAAIEEGWAMLDPAPPGDPAMSQYLAIHVKKDSRWLMSTVRDSRIESPSSYRNLADLEWLIGTWTAEEHGTKTVSTFRWIANKSFVERSYSVTTPNGLTTTGMQIIGWNPLDGHVQSWDFSAGGGHAIGVWTPREDGWQADARGVTGEGIGTSATNLLRRLDDNAYVWQSVNRTLGGQSLPDTDEVVIKRSVK